MPEIRNPPDLPREAIEISNALNGFTVVDADHVPVGVVKSVNLDRTCLLIESGGSLFSRRKQHAVHLGAITTINVEEFRVVLGVSKHDVEDAPEFRHLDAESHRAIEAYYDARLAASQHNSR
jgi:hypothetical protein